jgi:putative oxidoreductase
MDTRLAHYQDRVYAMLRVVSGVLLAWDGASVVSHIITPDNLIRDIPVLSPSQVLAIPILILQVVAGLAIAVGFRARLAALAASAAVGLSWLGWAYVNWYVLLSLGLERVRTVGPGAGWFLQFFLFLFIATRGPGIWSLDSRRKKSWNGSQSCADAPRVS